MNTDTLNAIDTLYLQAFHQNLLADILQAHISLKKRHEQAASLSLTKELTPAIRKNYGEVAEPLLALLSALSSLLDDMEAGALSWQGAVQPFERRLVEAAPEDKRAIIARLDTAENEILGVLNEVGSCLAGLSPSIISWDDSARLKTHVLLKRLAERPCYDEIQIDLQTHPFLIAEYASKPRAEAIPFGQWPHYLVDEMVPIELLPILDDVWIEMEVRGEGYASGRTQK